VDTNIPFHSDKCLSFVLVWLCDVHSLSVSIGATPIVPLGPAGQPVVENDSFVRKGKF
jgi:hypothetical protein